MGTELQQQYQLYNSQIDHLLVVPVERVDDLKAWERRVVQAQIVQEADASVTIPERPRWAKPISDYERITFANPKLSGRELF